MVLLEVQEQLFVGQKFDKIKFRLNFFFQKKLYTYAMRKHFTIESISIHSFLFCSTNVFLMLKIISILFVRTSVLEITYRHAAYQQQYYNQMCELIFDG